jgi:hypothetical protein
MFGGRRTMAIGVVTGNGMTHFLGIGIIFGLSAGLAPGPLLMLVISDTLRHGIKAGVKVALAPVITDLPIIHPDKVISLQGHAGNHFIGRRLFYRDNGL